jgi:hypothetical protein
MPALFRPHPGRRSGSVLLLLSAAGLLVSGTAGRAAATDPYVAGQAATNVAAAPDGEAAVQIERAVQTGRRLGLPQPARRTVERVEDRRGQATFDEVTEIDGQGQATALLRYAPDGRLLAAVHLGWQPDRGKTLSADADAVRVALDVARGAGFEPSGRAVPLRRGANGWSVGWDRVVDGVPVPGDGIRIQLQPDGTFHGLTRAEHPLATAPNTVLAAGVAQEAVNRLLDRWIPAASRADVRIDGSALAWVAPNDTFEPSRPDAPADVRRLAWVVRVRSVGAFAEVLRGLEVAIDAGDSSLLGGDVLR